MENHLELEKRPAKMQPSSEKQQTWQMPASMEPPALQLKVSQFKMEDEEDEKIQKKTVGQFKTGLPSTIQTSASEQFQGDFSGVNIHQNSQKASELGALAYTQGTDIHFAPNAYDPHSASGKALIGHELYHVKQQSEGRVQPTGSVGGMPLNDDSSLEREADEMGNRLAGA